MSRVLLIKLDPMIHRYYAGFKYIGNTALDLVMEGFDVPFGYEEAIGFMFGSDIRDKDGVAATVSLKSLLCNVIG